MSRERIQGEAFFPAIGELTDSDRALGWRDVTCATCGEVVGATNGGSPWARCSACVARYETSDGEDLRELVGPVAVPAAVGIGIAVLVALICLLLVGLPVSPR